MSEVFVTQNSETTKLAQSSDVYTEAPLHYYLGRQSGSQEAGVVITEAPLKGHLNLRGDLQDPDFEKSVELVLGVPLPPRPCSYETNGEKSIYWLGPNEWLLIVDGGSEAAVESHLREVFKGHISIVNISGGQTLINLRGADVETVLKKSSGYDFHPSHFGPGRCVQTTFAKATALVSKKADGSFDLLIRRSFADYLATWLLDAGREFGCRIERGF